MWIESIDIRGFGCLSNQRIDLPQGRAALVVEANESGKSTLAAAIVAGLCGIPSRRGPGEPVKLADVYRPWGGGPYAVTLGIEAGGGRWTVERDFARGSFAVRDAETNRDVSSEFRADLGLHFLGLGREDLLRVALISGKEVSRFKSSDSIRQRLTALVEGSSTDFGAETAITALERAQYTLDGHDIKPDTAIARLARSIDERSRQLRELDTALDSAGDDVRVLDQSRAKHDELSARLLELDREYAGARLKEVRDRMSAAEADEARIHALREEMALLEGYALFPADRKDQFTRALTRLSGHEARLRGLQDRSGALARQADELQASVDEMRHLVVATDDDLVALRAAGDTLRGAREEVERAERSAADAKRSGSGLLGRTLVVFGLLIGLASVALVIRRVLDIAPSVVGVLLGALVAAAGLVQIAKVSARSARLAAGITQARTFLAGACERAIRLLGPIGVQCPDGADLADVLKRTSDSLTKHLRDREALRIVRLEIAALSRESEQTIDAINEERETANSILSDAGVDPSLSLEEAQREFARRESKHRRWREIRDTLLPALEARAPAVDALERLKIEEAELSAVGSSETSRSPAEVDVDRKSVRADIERTAASIRELDHRVGMIVARYRHEYPALLEELSGLRSELGRVIRFGAAVRAAADVLAEVAARTRRRWATALNERVGEILPRLNPRYDDIRFDDTLDFTVRHVPDGRVIQRPEIDAQLSSGAKDQVYLAVRVACCLELSASGEPVPLILDDPLIAFDDSRFASALRYLVEVLARRQQVILLTCHGSRHEPFLNEPWFLESGAVVDLVADR